MNDVFVIEKWHVMSNGKEKKYFYDNLSNIQIDEMKDFSEIPCSNWVRSDYFEMIDCIINGKTYVIISDMTDMIDIIIKKGVDRGIINKDDIEEVYKWVEIKILERMDKINNIRKENKKRLYIGYILIFTLLIILIIVNI